MRRTAACWVLLSIVPAGAAGQCADELATFDAAGRIRGLWLEADLLYLSGDRLEIVDVGVPGAPALLGDVATPGPVGRGVVVGDGFAYVAADGGVAVVDVADPASPVVVGEVALERAAWSVALGAGILYVGLGDPGGVRSFDVTDPLRPVALGTLDGVPGGYTLDLEVRGGLLYAADGLGWSIVDVTDPSDPATVAASDQNAIAMDVVGDLVFVPNMVKTGLFVFEASPPDIELVGVYDPAGGFDSEGIDVEGDIAFIGNSQMGVRMIDVSDPAAPFEACAHGMPGGLADLVLVRGRVAYVTDRVNERLQVLDVTDALGCYPDFDGDGDLDILDFVAFAGALAAGDAVADCDLDGELNVLDFVCFQGHFQAGCE